MRSTLRLSEDLKARAVDLANDLGISFNSLVAVAVRDYVDARSKGRVLRGGSKGSTLVNQQASRPAKGKGK